MASQADRSEMQDFFDRLFSRDRDISVFLPFILGLSATGNDTNAVDAEEGGGTTRQSSDQETRVRIRSGDRIILVNPFTQGMVVVEGESGSLDSLFTQLVEKGGQPPASKASIEAMPSVVVGEGEDGGECAICLDEWEVGGVAKEMPCKHRFHTNCIGKWLGMHGSCPLCRHKMPVDEDELINKREEEAEQEQQGEGEEGDERRRVRREILVTFSLSGSNRSRSRTSGNQDSSDSSAESREMEN